MGLGIVSLLGLLHVEGGIGHTERVEDLFFHGAIIGGAGFGTGLIHVGRDVAGGGGHEVAVLKDLTELTGGAHATEQGKCGGGFVLLVLEEPFEVLAGQAGAGADEMSDLDLLRDGCVGESEAGVDLGDVVMPLVLDAAIKSVWASIGSDLPSSLTPMPPS